MVCKWHSNDNSTTKILLLEFILIYFTLWVLSGWCTLRCQHMESSLGTCHGDALGRGIVEYHGQPRVVVKVDNTQRERWIGHARGRVRSHNRSHVHYLGFGRCSYSQGDNHRAVFFSELICALEGE